MIIVIWWILLSGCSIHFGVSMCPIVAVIVITDGSAKPTCMGKNNQEGYHIRQSVGAVGVLFYSKDNGLPQCRSSVNEATDTKPRR